MFGPLQIDAIKRANVIAMIRRIKKRGSIVSEVKARQWTGQVFSYAIATGLIEINPTSEMHAVTEKGEPHRLLLFLPFNELPKTIAAIQDNISGHQLRSAIMLKISTASHPGEVRHAVWSEIDLDAATWITPASKMNARRDH